MEGWRGRKFAFLPSALFLLPCSFFLLKCLLPLALAKNLPDRGKIASTSLLQCPCFLHAICPCGRRCNERVGSNLCCRKCKVHKTGDFYYFCLVAVSYPIDRNDARCLLA